MGLHKLKIAVVGVVVALFAGPSVAGTPFSIGLFAGFGGSMDESDTGLDQTVVMAKFTVETRPRTDFAIRLGEIDIEQLGAVTDATLTYLTLSGDYWAYESFYESALYLGLGYYEISGLLGFAEVQESTVGVVLGALGEFDVTQNLSFQVEVSAHYSPMDVAQSFVMGQAGLAVHF